jgi:hypothetical protein
MAYENEIKNGGLPVALPTMSVQEEMMMVLNNYTHGNELYVKLLSHVVYGQLFKDLKVPTGKSRVYGGRTSVFVIRNQGTGKNEPVVPVRKICKYIRNKAMEELNLTILRFNKITEMTDAALIGTTVEFRQRGQPTENRPVEGLL